MVSGRVDLFETTSAMLGYRYETRALPAHKLVLSTVSCGLLAQSVFLHPVSSSFAATGRTFCSLRLVCLFVISSSFCFSVLRIRSTREGGILETIPRNGRDRFRHEVHYANARLCRGYFFPGRVLQLGAAFVTHPRQHTKSVEGHCAPCRCFRRRLVGYGRVSSGFTTKGDCPRQRPLSGGDLGRSLV
jgi:hypothetical protein